MAVTDGFLMEVGSDGDGYSLRCSSSLEMVSVCLGRHGVVFGIDEVGDLEVSLLQEAVRCGRDIGWMDVLSVVGEFLCWGHVEMGRAGMNKPVISVPFKNPDGMWYNIGRTRHLCRL